MTDQTNAPIVENTLPLPLRESKSEAPVTQELSAGQLLREAREARGMDIGLLASTLKVSVAKLESLEADRFDDLPDVAFIRSLAISVCKRLGIDETQVLARLPQRTNQQSSYTPIDMSSTMRPNVMKKTFGKPKKSRIGWILLGLLLIALAVLFLLKPANWYETLLSQDLSSSATQTVASVQGGQGVSTESVSILPAVSRIEPGTTTIAIPVDTGSGMINTSEGATNSQTSLAGIANVDPPPASIIVPEAQSVTPNAMAMDAEVADDATPSLAVVQPPTATAAQADTSAPPVPESISTDVAFTATADSWIAVYTKNGDMLVSKMLHAGENLSVPLQNLPFNVTVGNAQVTTVLVRGKPFLIASYTVGNVAKFEVK